VTTDYRITLRFNCAAYPNGCLSFLQFEAPPGMALPAFNPASHAAVTFLDSFVERDMDERVEWYLLEHDWRRVGGRWVCHLHPEKPGG
jgi:hypothetical protein